MLTLFRQDLVTCGMVTAACTVRLGMVAGHVYRDRSDELRAHIEGKGWLFWSPEYVAEMVGHLAGMGYENGPAIIMAKILRNGG